MTKKTQKLQRIAALSLAGLLSCSGLTACNGIDPHKNQSHLNIKVFNGGFGHEWLKELISSFEETFKDVSFEEGKKGVHVALTPNKEFTDLHLKMAMGTDAEDIYYTSTSDFLPFIDNEVAYDVTDIMTANVYDENGEVVLNADGNGWKTQEGYQSIVDRISLETTRERLNMGTEENPKYMVLPFEDTVTGFVVDWDLFVEQGWNDYNGIDGMPATIYEFYDLLGRIRKKGYSGFIFSTGVQYSKTIQPAVIAQVEGSDVWYDLFSDYIGEYDFNEDGEITVDERITPNTAYKLIDTKGYEEAVNMAFKLFEQTDNGKTFYDPAVVNGISYGAAQQDFLMSKETNTRIAMLIEGEWWENEARATFNAMSTNNDENAYGEREFRMMPIPSFDETNGDPDDPSDDRYTLGTWTGGCAVVVNEKTVGDDPVKQELAKLWLQYQNSTEGLKCFTKHTSVTLPLEYELDEDELEELTPFGRNLYKLKRDSRVEIIHRSISIEAEHVYRGGVKLDFAARIQIGNAVGKYTDPLFNNMAKSLYNKNLTAKDYIQGLHTNYDEPFKNADFKLADYGINLDDYWTTEE